MDEHKLAELFQSAVRETPPASFDDRDVAAASDRITRRRRQALAGGGGVVVVAALAVGLFYGVSGLGQTLNRSSAGMAANAPAQQSDTARSNLNAAPFAHRAGGTGFPSESPMQGGEASGKVGPGADSTSQGCGPTDRKLAVALANELPSVGAQAANPAGLACPAGTRSATYTVSGGTVTALLVPPDTASAVRAGTLTFTETPAASGEWTVFVLTQATAEAAAGDVSSAADGIAAQF